MRYLLDTNILSDLIRNPRGTVRRKLDIVPENRVVTSIIVAGELRFGAARRQSASLEGKVVQMLNSFPVLPFEHPAEVLYGDLRARLERTGRPIGNNDILIAAHALASDCVLVTDKVREVGRIESLAIENWLRDVGPS